MLIFVETLTTADYLMMFVLLVEVRRVQKPDHRGEPRRVHDSCHLLIDTVTTGAVTGPGGLLHSSFN